MQSYNRVLHGADRAGVGVANHRSAQRATIATDSTLLVLSLLGAVFAYAAVEFELNSIEGFLSARVKLLNVAIVSALYFSWRFVCRAFRLYEGRPNSAARARRNSIRTVRVAIANAVNTGLLATGAVLFDISVVTGPVLAAFWAMSTGSMLTFRLALAAIQPRFQTTSAVARSVLIVGTNDRARAFGDRLEKEPGDAVRLVGFCDDPWSGLERFEEERGSVVTDFKKFTEFLRMTVVDEVVIALPLDVLRENDSAILPACETLGVTVHFLGNVLSDNPLESTAAHDEVMVTVHHGLVEGSALAVKRAFDVAASALLLALVSPMLLLAGIALRLESRGPIIFKQVRIGLNKRPFDMYKLRSMYEDAELRQASLESQNEVDGAAFKIENDPRITKVGNFLRRTSLDELPQLVNVLRGEMSLIGPRPLPLRDFARFDLDAHRRRFSVYPGITGLWQVSGRSSLSFEDWMQLDLDYVDQWSLWLDFKIAIKTIPAVLMSVGAR